MRRWLIPIYHLADLIMPRACAGCDRPMAGETELLCRDCQTRMSADCGTDYCPRCGKIAEPYLTTETGCPDCRHHRGPLDGLVRVGTYGGIVGDLVKRFKFGGQQHLDLVLGSHLADALERHTWRDQLDALIPVPTDWHGRRRYGFHPAGLIAQVTGKRLGLPVLPLVRVRGKRRRQVGLPQTDRIKNVRGKFYVAPAARVAGATLCIVDDVSTSGATLREIARVLKRAGAARVFGAVAAKTQLGEDIQTTPPGLSNGLPASGASNPAG